MQPLIDAQVVSMLLSFILFMVSHPEVQKSAQKEILRVIGSDRLPTFEDRDALPYVESILIEVLRLRPPVSAGAFIRSGRVEGYALLMERYV